MGACLKFPFTALAFPFTAAPPPEPGRQHGLRPLALSSGAFCVQCPKHFMAAPLKPQTEPVANMEAHGLTVSHLPDIPHLRSSALKCPLQGTRPSTPPHVAAQRAPGCNRSSGGRAVLEGHPAFGFLGEAACSVEATSLGHPADSKNAVRRLQNAPATAAAQPQKNSPRSLKSEEPANAATPSIPDPQLWSVPLSKWGLHGSSTAGSQHAPKNTAAQAPSTRALQLRKMVELWNPCVKLPHTSAPPPEPGRQHDLRPVALSSGHFNREAHGLAMSVLPDISDIPHLRSSALKCPLQGTRPSTPPHVVAQRAPGCNRSSGGRAVLEGHRAFGFLGEAACSVEATAWAKKPRLGRQTF